MDATGTPRPPEPSSAPARCATPGAGRGIDAEFGDVLARAARVGDGLELVEGAPLECAAVLLGVPPRVIERLRAALADPLAREAARAHLARAAASGAAATAARPPPAAPHDAEQLLAAASAPAERLAVLLAAAPECAAVAFGVRPDLVHAARELARRRGVSLEVPTEL